MIQDSINQMLGQLGVIGGYMSHIKSNALTQGMNDTVNAAKYDADMQAKYGQADAAKDALTQAQKDITPKGIKKLTTPPQALMESKRLSGELELAKTKKYNEALESMGKAQAKSEKVGEPKGEPVTIGGQKVNMNELPPKVQQFLAGQASPQEQAKATAIQSFTNNGMARVQQAQDLANLKDILQSRHSKGANRKEALDYIEKREKENK